MIPRIGHAILLLWAILGINLLGCASSNTLRANWQEDVAEQDLADIMAVRRIERLELAFLKSSSTVNNYLKEKQRFVSWLKGTLENQSPDGPICSAYYDLGWFFLPLDDFAKLYIKKEINFQKYILETLHTIENSPGTEASSSAWRKLNAEVTVFWTGNSGLPCPLQVRETLRLYQRIAGL